MTTMDTAEQPRLDYAPGAPVRRRRRVRRVVAVVLALVVAVVGWRYGPWGWGRGKLLYAQHRCLAYSPPADLVVFESEQARARELLKRAGYTAIPMYTLTWGRQSPPLTAAGYRPPPLADFEGLLGGPFTSGACGILFMHEMRDKAGNRRLVICFRDANAMGPLFATFGIWATVWDPATLRAPPRPTPKRNAYGWDYDGPGWDLPGKNLRFYAGQIDPADAGHFTIRYEMDAQEGIVDGRLNADGDDVEITVRSGPAAPPSPWSSPLAPTFGTRPVAPAR
jgi:hypothetical protein